MRLLYIAVFIHCSTASSSRSKINGSYKNITSLTKDYKKPIKFTLPINYTVDWNVKNRNKRLSQVLKVKGREYKLTANVCRNLPPSRQGTPLFSIVFNATHQKHYCLFTYQGVMNTTMGEMYCNKLYVPSTLLSFETEEEHLFLAKNFLEKGVVYSLGSIGKNRKFMDNRDATYVLGKLNKKSNEAKKYCNGVKDINIGVVNCNDLLYTVCMIPAEKLQVLTFVLGTFGFNTPSNELFMRISNNETAGKCVHYKYEENDLNTILVSVNNNKRYYCLIDIQSFPMGNLRYSEGVRRCAELGGEMIYIESVEEDFFLHELLMEKTYELIPIKHRLFDPKTAGDISKYLIDRISAEKNPSTDQRCLFLAKSISRAEETIPCDHLADVTYFHDNAPFLVKEDNGKKFYCIHLLQVKESLNFYEAEAYCKSFRSTNLLMISNHNEKVFLADKLFPIFEEQSGRKGSYLKIQLRPSSKETDYSYQKAFYNKFYHSRGKCVFFVRSYRLKQDQFWFGNCVMKMNEIVCQTSVRWPTKRLMTKKSMLTIVTPKKTMLQNTTSAARAPLFPIAMTPATITLPGGIPIWLAVLITAFGIMVLNLLGCIGYMLIKKTVLREAATQLTFPFYDSPANLEKQIYDIIQDSIAEMASRTEYFYGALSHNPMIDYNNRSAKFMRDYDSRATTTRSLHGYEAAPERRVRLSYSYDSNPGYNERFMRLPYGIESEMEPNRKFSKPGYEESSSSGRAVPYTGDLFAPGGRTDVSRHSNQRMKRTTSKEGHSYRGSAHYGEDVMR